MTGSEKSSGSPMDTEGRLPLLLPVLLGPCWVFLEPGAFLELLAALGPGWVELYMVARLLLLSTSSTSSL